MTPLSYPAAPPGHSPQHLEVITPDLAIGFLVWGTNDGIIARAKDQVSLASGTRIGIYEIVAPIGAGGMGEVYRARDTRLNRDVALKILPDTFAADTSRVTRFRREAQLLATLNHTNIAQIYGFEEIALRSDQAVASAAIGLELVDGRTIADRLLEGPLPLDDTLPIARQIAEALETAHHRPGFQRQDQLVALHTHRDRLWRHRVWRRDNISLWASS